MNPISSPAPRWATYSLHTGGQQVRSKVRGRLGRRVSNHESLLPAKRYDVMVITNRKSTIKTGMTTVYCSIILKKLLEFGLIGCHSQVLLTPFSCPPRRMRMSRKPATAWWREYWKTRSGWTIRTPTSNSIMAGIAEITALIAQTEDSR